MQSPFHEDAVDCTEMYRYTSMNAVGFGMFRAWHQAEHALYDMC